MLVVVAVVHAVFTLPYHVTWLFSVFGYPNSVAKKLCVLLVIATSAAHPIIYGTLNQEFGRGFKSFFLRFTRERNENIEEIKGATARVTRRHGLGKCNQVNDIQQVKNFNGISSHEIAKPESPKHAQFRTLVFDACNLKKEINETANDIVNPVNFLFLRKNSSL